MRIAFIGLGIMGGPMAGHLAKAGHDVVVFNRTPEKAAAWVAEHGGRAAATPREAAAGAAIVCACVGADGAGAGAGSGAVGAGARCGAGAAFAAPGRKILDMIEPKMLICCSCCGDAPQRSARWTCSPGHG